MNDSGYSAPVSYFNSDNSMNISVKCLAFMIIDTFYIEFKKHILPRAFIS